MKTAIREVQRAFVERDLDKLCERMTAAAQTQAGSVAHGRPTTCPRNVHRFMRAFSESGGDPERAPRVETVAADGDAAVATALLPDGTSVDIPLAKDDGEWRIDSVAGVPKRRTLKIEAETRRAPFPPAGEGGVEVARRSGERCFDFFSTDDLSNVRGDCTFHGAGDVEVTAGTPFGRFRFGICNLDYYVIADGEGRTWTSVIFESGEEGQGWPFSGCGDVDLCQGEQSAGLIWWKGRLRREAGRLVNRVEACLQTCVGYFRGTLTATLRQRGGRLRSWEFAGGLGDDGLRLDGSVPIDPVDIAVRSR